MRYLGLDLGSKTLGIAVSDATGTIATGQNVIRHDENYDQLVNDVLVIVKEKEINEIVLGLPKNMNNTIGFKGQLSIEFKEKLENACNITVHLMDERLTTKQAQDILISNNTRREKRKKVIDSMAATIILQSYLDKK
jgi:RNAse H-fold protein YqgF